MLNPNTSENTAPNPENDEADTPARRFVRDHGGLIAELVATADRLRHLDGPGRKRWVRAALVEALRGVDLPYVKGRLETFAKGAIVDAAIESLVLLEYIPLKSERKKPMPAESAAWSSATEALRSGGRSTVEIEPPSRVGADLLAALLESARENGRLEERNAATTEALNRARFGAGPAASFPPEPGDEVAGE